MKIPMLNIVRAFGIAILFGAFGWSANADSDPKPKAPTVTVLGAVKDPGTYDYRVNMTVMDALTVSGGVVVDSADLSSATLTHDGKERPLDLTGLLKRGDMVNNVTLSPGDCIIVPENHSRVYVFGEVRQPGFCNLHANDRLVDVLAAVGGPLPTADLDKISLIHISPKKNCAIFEKDDLGRYLRFGDGSANKLIQAGDCIYVPSKERSFRPQDLWVPLQKLHLLNDNARLIPPGDGGHCDLNHSIMLVSSLTRSVPRYILEL